MFKKSSMILAIETATDVCSVAFENENSKIFEKRVESRGSHSQKLFLFIEELMKEHQFSVGDLSAVLVSEGPGSYTGLRIAASGVKGLLFDSEVPMYGAQTLASFAMAALGKETDVTGIHALIDARRKHLYHQRFQLRNGIMEALVHVEIMPIKSFEKIIQPGDIIIGTGLDRLDEKLVKKAECLGQEAVTAQSLIKLYHRQEATKFMQRVSAEEFDPKYYTSNQV